MGFLHLLQKCSSGSAQAYFAPADKSVFDSMRFRKTSMLCCTSCKVTRRVKLSAGRFWQREPGADVDADGASQSLRSDANDSR
jgi:hypothetical protein